MCNSWRDSIETAGSCDSVLPGGKNIGQMTQKLVNNHSEKMGIQIKQIYLERARLALSQQMNLVSWLSENKNNSYLSSSGVKPQFEQMKASCVKVQGFAVDGLAQIGNEAQVQKELGFNDTSASRQESIRDDMLKRSLLAWIQSNWIEGIGMTTAKTESEKLKWQNHLNHLRQGFFMVTYRKEYELGQLLDKEYGSPGLSQEDLRPGSQLESILFVDPKTHRYKPIKFIEPMSPFNKLAQTILDRPLSEKMRIALRKLFAHSLAGSLESMKALCESSSCEAMSIDFKTTAEFINQKDQDERRLSLGAACSCNMRSPNEYVGLPTKLALVGGSIGGLVLCPVTFGLGCYVAGASAAGYAVAAGADTIAAYGDLKKSEALYRTAQALPDFSEETKTELRNEKEENGKRVFEGTVDTALSLAPLGMVGKGASKYTITDELLEPLEKVTTSSERVVQATKLDLADLREMGVGFSPIKGAKTRLGELVEENSNKVHFTSAPGQKEYVGEILEITKLPKSTGLSGPKVTALEHQEMAGFFKKIKDRGYKLVVDTSLTESPVGAYMNAESKVIGISPYTSWDVFQHEFQHLQFAEFIEPHFAKLEKAVQVRGRHLNDILPKSVKDQYSAKDLARLEKLIKAENGIQGVDESMAVYRQLDQTGWLTWSHDINVGAREYGALNRYESLINIQRETGIALSKQQLSTLESSKRTVVFLKSLNKETAQRATSAVLGTGAAEAYVIYKEVDGKYSLSPANQVYYHEKYKAVVTKTRDGELIYIQPTIVSPSGGAPQKGGEQ